MCGIAGLITGRTGTVEVIGRMTDRLRHRGPDDRGTWTDEAAGIALGHRRLAIVDLSAQGHQPMHSADGRWVIAYNGEVYNHREIRAALEAAKASPDGGWRGHSDTETLVQAVAAWGLERTLSLAVGMFAFAAWDRSDRKLYLARDRFGEKPLYYGWVGGDFLFGSELKALTAHPKFDNPISSDSLSAYMSRTYVPAPLSIYRDIFKLLPGCVLALDRSAAGAVQHESPREGVAEGGASLSRYWSYGTVLEEGGADPIRDEASAVEALDEALGRSIRGQSMADVPVGAFLSGGIDSSTVVALYQKHSSVPVRSFTIGFDDSHFDEARYAKRVAQALGTVHHETYVSAADARAVIPQLTTIFDEPFGDSSAIPTYLVSRFARQSVTVALSGDGGDELFAGYRRHWQALGVWKKLRHIPLGARRAGAAALRHVPQRVWAGMDGLPGSSRRSPLSGKVRKGLHLGASVRSFEDLYTGYLDQWALEPHPVNDPGASAPGFPFDPGFRASDAVRMTYCDAMAYLPDDILCKVDRASMAVSLETRVPFLDHRVAAVAARIPMAMKLRGTSGKWIVREVLGRHLPSELFERPKSGFSMPLTDWLSGSLRDWAEDLLDPSQMRDQGFLDVERVHGRWQDTLARRRNSSGAMWAVLMFQSFLRNQGAASTMLRDHAA